jgi:hypothetical protein
MLEIYCIKYKHFQHFHWQFYILYYNVSIFHLPIFYASSNRKYLFKLQSDYFRRAFYEVLKYFLPYHIPRFCSLNHKLWPLHTIILHVLDLSIIFCFRAQAFFYTLKIMSYWRVFGHQRKNVKPFRYLMLQIDHACPRFWRRWLQFINYGGWFVQCHTCAPRGAKQKHKNTTE